MARIQGIITLMMLCTIDLSKIEKIDPIRHYSKWKLDCQHKYRRVGETYDAEASEELRVYSDESPVEGGVGRTAVLMRGEEEIQTKRMYLGSDRDYTVYEAELIGMILAIQILREEGEA
ncbi:hypothetical protein BDR04DRAFT_1123336 [Suillus decipiens]|nr:hypothetical protein BDR04DRAFT_1123336 [Suillus decipiens]